ncbi:MAG: 30S ribosome-binding factor RbfA [Rubricella sp.]
MSRSRSHPGRGPSQRQLRVGELIRRALSDLLIRGDLFIPELEGIPITVGEVQTSPDLRVARVHVLPLGGKEADAVVAALNANAKSIRMALSREIELKYSPELRFRADRTFDRMDETRDLLSSERVRSDIDRQDEG